MVQQALHCGTDLLVKLCQLHQYAVPQMLLDLLFLSPKYCNAESSAKGAL